jgi:hypothetical protein
MDRHYIKYTSLKSKNEAYRNVAQPINISDNEDNDQELAKMFEIIIHT